MRTLGLFGEMSVLARLLSDAALTPECDVESVRRGERSVATPSATDRRADPSQRIPAERIPAERIPAERIPAEGESALEARSSAHFGIAASSESSA